MSSLAGSVFHDKSVMKELGLYGTGEGVNLLVAHPGHGLGVELQKMRC